VEFLEEPRRPPILGSGRCKCGLEFRSEGIVGRFHWKRCLRGVFLLAFGIDGFAVPLLPGGFRSPSRELSLGNGVGCLSDPLQRVIVDGDAIPIWSRSCGGVVAPFPSV
jgi:hypothetical protein